MKLELKLNSYELNKLETMITPFINFCMKKRMINSLESITDLFKMARAHADKKYMADHKSYSVVLRRDKDDNYVASFDFKYNFIDTMSEVGSKWGRMLTKIFGAIFELAHSGVMDDLDELSDNSTENNDLFPDERVAVIGRKPVLFKNAWKSEDSIDMEKTIMDGCTSYCMNHKDATDILNYVENIMRLNPCTARDNKKFFYDIYNKYSPDASDLAKYLYWKRLGIDAPCIL